MSSETGSRLVLCTKPNVVSLIELPSRTHKIDLEMKIFAEIDHVLPSPCAQFICLAGSAADGDPNHCVLVIVNMQLKTRLVYNLFSGLDNVEWSAAGQWIICRTDNGSCVALHNSSSKRVVHLNTCCDAIHAIVIDDFIPHPSEDNIVACMDSYSCIYIICLETRQVVLLRNFDADQVYMEWMDLFGRTELAVITRKLQDPDHHIPESIDTTDRNAMQSMLYFLCPGQVSESDETLEIKCEDFHFEIASQCIHIVNGTRLTIYWRDALGSPTQKQELDFDCEILNVSETADKTMLAVLLCNAPATRRSSSEFIDCLTRQIVDWAPPHAVDICPRRMYYFTRGSSTDLHSINCYRLRDSVHMWSHPFTVLTFHGQTVCQISSPLQSVYQFIDNPERRAQFPSDWIVSPVPDETGSSCRLKSAAKLF